MIAQNWSLRVLKLHVFFFPSGSSHQIMLNQLSITGLQQPSCMHVLQPGWRLNLPIIPGDDLWVKFISLSDLCLSGFSGFSADIFRCLHNKDLVELSEIHKKLDK